MNTKFADRVPGVAPRIVPRIDFSKLKKICRMKEVDFHHFGRKINTLDGIYYYKDNGSNILFVGHLDSVRLYNGFDTLKIDGDVEIYCKTLDDRLGVYLGLMLNELPGVNFDILLTTNEEKGNSTANWFEPPVNKKYNWIFSFDKAGTGVVMYQYKDNHDAVGSVISAGFGSPSYGIYSCIAELEHLNCVGFNFGAGYHNHHTTRAYASLNDIRSQVQKFLYFYNKYSNVDFPYFRKMNILTRHGFGYDPTIDGTFNEEEIDVLTQENVYERLSKGQAIELVDNVVVTKITPKLVNKIMSNMEYSPAPVIRAPLVDVKTSKVKKGGIAIGKVKDIKDAKEIIDKTGAKTHMSIIRTQHVKREKEEKLICIDCGKEFKPPAINVSVLNDSTAMQVAFCDECLKSKHDNFMYENSNPLFQRMMRYAEHNSKSLAEIAKYMKNQLSEEAIKYIVDRLVIEKLIKRYWSGGMYPTDQKTDKLFMPNRVLSVWMNRNGIDLATTTTGAKAIGRIERNKDEYIKWNLAQVLIYLDELARITTPEARDAYFKLYVSMLSKKVEDKVFIPFGKLAVMTNPNYILQGDPDGYKWVPIKSGKINA